MNKKIVIIAAGLIALVALGPIIASGQGPVDPKIEISDELNKVEFVHFEEGTSFSIDFENIKNKKIVTVVGTISYEDDYKGNAYTVAIGEVEPNNGECIDLKKATYDVTATAGEETVEGTIVIP